MSKAGFDTKVIMEELSKNFNKEIKKKKDDSFFRSISGWDGSPSDLSTLGFNYKAFDEILASYGMNFKKVKVLELGSGNAAFLDYMKTQGVDAVGVDVHPRGGARITPSCCSYRTIAF